MALILPSRATRITQPQGPCAVDFAHPLAHYAVAAWAGHRHNIDALGNAMAWVGGGIESRTGLDGIEQYQTGSTESLGYWVDKNIGVFNTDDFFIQCRVTPGVNASGTAFIAKGDAGGAEWMIGDSSAAGSNIRFFGAAGGINAATGSTVFPDGVKSTVSATRVAGVLQVFINGELASTDVTATGNLSDLVHHMTLCGADYSGTTFDTARNYIGGLSQAIVLRGIGGESVAKELHRNPWQLFRPASRSIIVDLGAGGGPTLINLDPSSFSFVPQSFQNALESSLGVSSFSIDPQDISAGGSAALELDEVTFQFIPQAIQGGQLLSIDSKAFSIQTNNVSQEQEFSLNSQSLDITSTDFQNEQAMFFGTTSVNIDGETIEYINERDSQLGSVEFNINANPISLPVVLSISDQINSIIYIKLRENGYTGSLNEMLRRFFGGEGTLQDCERLWLISVTGDTEGTNQDLWMIYLNSLGYSGAFPDMLKDFWINY